MRIGIDARFYGTTGKGLGRYTQKLIHELENIDTENEYIVFLSAENIDAYRPVSGRFRKVLCRARWYSFAEQFWLPFFLASFRLDLMHFPHFNVPLLYRRPFLFTLHDLILFHFPTRRASTRSRIFYRMKFLGYRLVLRSALQRARKVIAVSHFTESDILTNFPQIAPKLSVTYEAAESFCHFASKQKALEVLEEFGLAEQEVGRAILQPYILYVGNAYPHKNLELVLSLALNFPQEHFVLVGKEDYFYARLKREASARGLGNILFIGALSDQELGIFYRFARIYFFPSLYEGFGLPPLEAMNYGLPVLSSNAASLPEILGEAAHYFDPTDPSDAKAKLSRLLQDEEERFKARRSGFEHSGRFSWRRMAEETLALYRSIPKSR
ncbi:MAG: glycosyltransferase family 1 protein [Candidatus Moraniibacteriota bacterium]